MPLFQSQLYKHIDHTDRSRHVAWVTMTFFPLLFLDLSYLALILSAIRHQNIKFTIFFMRVAKNYYCIMENYITYTC